MLLPNIFSHPYPGDMKSNNNKLTTRYNIKPPFPPPPHQFSRSRIKKLKEGMTVPTPSIAAVSIASLMGAGGGSHIFVAEALCGRRRGVPLLAVRRRGIKYYKPESENSNSDMCTKVIGGDTYGIASSRRNEKYMKSYK